MNDVAPPFVWPSASTLVRRAEQSLEIVRPIGPAAAQLAPVAPTIAVDIASLESRLVAIERGYWTLVPPGFESGGRLASVKRLFKRVSRRFMWWYVEPRWIVQRELTAEFAGFSASTIEAMRLMSVEMDGLRARIDELDRRLAGQST